MRYDFGGFRRACVGKDGDRDGWRPRGSARSGLLCFCFVSLFFFFFFPSRECCGYVGKRLEALYNDFLQIQKVPAILLY